MKIVIASLNFPNIPRTLTRLLPRDRIEPCADADLREAVRQADVLVPTMARVGASMMDGCGLKLIQQWGVGLEGVDIAAAAAHGIPVCNVPADAAPANAESTAEHALFLMMAVARRFHAARRSLESGPVWGAPEGTALFGRQALIVGLGRVGSFLAHRLTAMGMDVKGIKARPVFGSTALDQANIGGPDDLLSMIKEADFVISTLPVTPWTTGLFNRDVFGTMKAGAVFVNVGRGGVVVEEALVESLDRGHLSGAGLDVFTVEPLPKDHPFIGHEKIVATPHLAGITVQSSEALGKQVAENIERLRQGRPLMNQAHASAMAAR